MDGGPSPQSEESSRFILHRNELNNGPLLVFSEIIRPCKHKGEAEPMQNHRSHIMCMKQSKPSFIYYACMEGKARAGGDGVRQAGALQKSAN